MRCDFCQNWHISQKQPDRSDSRTTPENIISKALLTKNNIGIAFTYNEPIISFEFMRDVAIMAKEKGLFTVMVSNGFVNKEPLAEIITFIDAFNIDLKAFNNSFYKKLTGSEIEPVKNSLKQIAVSGKHLEITTLIIPGQNDSENDMAMQSGWIAGELGKDVPLHLSRYHPMYKRSDAATPEVTLGRLYEIASKNLQYVYVGNSVSATGQNTSCPECGTIVTKRSGYRTELINLTGEGRCTSCNNLIYKYLTTS
jgi:pyruvate formate lyase activating enzyme